jgi:hypothetical protein
MFIINHLKCIRFIIHINDINKSLISEKYFPEEKGPNRRSIIMVNFAIPLNLLINSKNILK